MQNLLRRNIVSRSIRRSMQCSPLICEGLSVGKARQRHLQSQQGPSGGTGDDFVPSRARPPGVDEICASIVQIKRWGYGEGCVSFRECTPETNVDQNSKKGELNLFIDDCLLDTREKSQYHKVGGRQWQPKTQSLYSRRRSSDNLAARSNETQD